MLDKLRAGFHPAHTVCFLGQSGLPNAHGLTVAASGIVVVAPAVSCVAVCPPGDGDVSGIVGIADWIAVTPGACWIALQPKSEETAMIPTAIRASMVCFFMIFTFPMVL